MSDALQLIVDGYVRLNDRGALTELKAHREDLLAALQAKRGWLDLSRSIGDMEEEINQVDAGLARLDAGHGGLTFLGSPDFISPRFA